MKPFDKDEIQQWEIQLLETAVKRMFKTEKVYRCPRKEKLNDYRHHRGTKYWYSGECKWVRQNSNRKFRRKNRPYHLNEDCPKPVPHDYKTYGWITW